MNFDPDRGFAEAMLALQAGKLGDAERLCNAVLRGEPKHVEALNLLGSFSAGWAATLRRSQASTGPWLRLQIRSTPGMAAA
jgi:hypothetical protein